MKSYLRYAALFAVAVVILVGIYILRQATEPESAIIAKERGRLFDSRDKGRQEKDPVYARELEEKLDFLDYRLAVAYNAENQSGKAADVLRRLIRNEEAGERSGIPRRSRSYADEARYYEALKESFDLKHDQAEANKALDRSTELMMKAAELRRTEGREEGRHVGAPAD